MDIVLKILSAIAIAGISSLITVHLSLQRFRTEKWWEKKAEAYSDLIATLHDAKAFSEENIEAEQKNRELTDEENKELRALAKQTEKEIYKAMDVGGFFLSEEAIDCLIEYKKESSEASNTTDWWEYLAKDYDATNKCLKNMIEIARKDLRIK